MKELVSLLVEEFKDETYAHTYMESHAVSRIAAQVHALRKQRGLSQEQLSQLAGIAQERVSKIESADFESLTMKTLQKLSRAFDVNLRVSFEAFSDGIIDVVNMNAKSLEVITRIDDLEKMVTQVIRRNGIGDWHSVPNIGLYPVGQAVPTYQAGSPEANENWHNFGETYTQPPQLAEA